MRHLDADTRARLCHARERLREVRDTSPLDAIAREAGMSRFHFLRTYAAVFGVTPHQDRVDARIERARHLLVLGEAPVTEVCFAVGFSSLGSFSALFHRRVGEPPSRYRRRYHALGGVPTALPREVAPGCLTLLWAAWESPQFWRSGSDAAR